MTASRRLLAVEALATAAAAAAGLTLYRNLDYAIRDTKLPALVVVDGSDQPVPGYVTSQEWQAVVDVTVLVAASSNPAADADGYESLIHAAIVGLTTLGGVPVIVEPIGGDWDFSFGDCAARHCGYRITYQTAATSLTTL